MTTTMTTTMTTWEIKKPDVTDIDGILGRMSGSIEKSDLTPLIEITREAAHEIDSWIKIMREDYQVNSGKYYKWLSKWRGDRNPSFSVDLERGSATDWSTDEKFDLISAHIKLSEYYDKRNLTFPEAVVEVVDIIGADYNLPISFDPRFRVPDEPLPDGRKYINMERDGIPDHRDMTRYFMWWHFKSVDDQTSDTYKAVIKYDLDERGEIRTIKFADGNVKLRFSGYVENPEPVLADFTHARFGCPINLWIYRNDIGQPQFAEVRYWDQKAAKKESRYVRIRYYDDDPDYVMSHWEWFGPEAPRLLYNYWTMLRTEPKAVLLCEGPKAADAANVRLRRHYGNKKPPPDDMCRMWPYPQGASPVLAMAWSGGARSWNLSDWDAIKDRNVIIWPDNDHEGFRAAAGLRQHLKNISDAKVGVARVPESWAEKWDLADTNPDEVSDDDIITLITKGFWHG